jgi:hypothetical protein
VSPEQGPKIGKTLQGRVLLDHTQHHSNLVRLLILFVHNMDYFNARVTDTSNEQIHSQLVLKPHQEQEAKLANTAAPRPTTLKCVGNPEFDPLENDFNFFLKSSS